MKMLEAHTFVCVNFEGKLLQNLGERVLKKQGVIWPSQKITDHNFKILKTPGEKSCCCLQCSKKGDGA